METHLRSQNVGVDFLSSQAQELNFYQAVRLLEKQVSLGFGGNSTIDDAPVDGVSVEGAPVDNNLGNTEPKNILFKSVNTQAFTPNAVAGISQKFNHAQVKVNSFGLLGQQGPVPDIFSELIQRTSEAGNTGPEAFLNLFNHRFIKLLFDIKQQLDPMLFNDRIEDSTLYQFAHALLGLWTNDMHQKLPLSLSQMLSFSVLFIGNKQNYSSFKQMLECVLHCEAQISPCAGAWKPLPKKYQAQLGEANTTLGSGVGLGCRYWDNQAGIDVHLKMPSLSACAALRPQGHKHPHLVALLSFLTDGHYQVNVTLSVPWQKLPVSQLDADDAQTPMKPANEENRIHQQRNQPLPMRLGHTTWLKSSEEASPVQSPLPQADNSNPRPAPPNKQVKDRVYAPFVVYPSLSQNFDANDDLSNFNLTNVSKTATDHGGQA